MPGNYRAVYMVERQHGVLQSNKSLNLTFSAAILGSVSFLYHAETLMLLLRNLNIDIVEIL